MDFWDMHELSLMSSELDELEARGRRDELSLMSSELDEPEGQLRENTQIRKRRRGMSSVVRKKAAHKVNLKDATIIKVNEWPDMFNSKLPIARKITHEENEATEGEMKAYMMQLEEQGKLFEFLAFQPPKPVRVLFRIKDDDAGSVKASRKASDRFIRELFHWNRAECSRMIEMLK